MKNSKDSGFTLVELSIVLVIIGLLIGGILVAQSLIDSTKIQSFVRQVGQFDAAVGVFKDRFGGLPGDNNVTQAIGDSNGYIAETDDTINAYADEMPLAWSDLAIAGLKNPNGTAYSGDDTVALGVDIPSSEVGSSSTGIIAAGSSVLSGNFWFVGDFSGTTGDGSNISIANSVAETDAVAIDVKMDNGVGNTGNVVSDDNTTAVTDLDAFTTAASDAFDLSAENDVKMRIRMGVSTGNLQ